jgi:hypothetical protein
MDIPYCKNYIKIVRLNPDFSVRNGGFLWGE